MDILRDNAAGLSGLEQMRCLLETRAQASIGRTMGFRLIEIEAGRAVFEGHPDATVTNPIGSVHGGYAAALLDSACGCAVHSRLTATQGYTTLELKVAYHRALQPNQCAVRAEGSVLSLGRRVAFAEAKLLDEAGRLCASATSTLLVFDLPAP